MLDRVHLEEVEFELKKAPGMLSQALCEAFGAMALLGVPVALKHWPEHGKVVLCVRYDDGWYQLIREVRS